MKKIYFLFFLLMLTSFLWAQRQTVIDFEDNTTNFFAGSGSNTVTAVANPVPSGVNISNYVIEYVSSSQWAWGMARWDNSSLLNQDHETFLVDVYFVDASGTFKLQMDNSISGAASVERYYDVQANTWETIEFDISGSALDYKQIAFQAGVAATIYIDNIRIVEGVATDRVLATFETDLEGWTTWGAPLSQVSNPNQTGNTSANVAVLDQSSGAWSGMAKWYGSPSILNPNKYIKLSIDVYYPTESQRFQLYMDNSESGAANHTDYNDNVPVGEWTTLEFDLTSLPANDYQQIAFQSGAETPVYMDNIILKVEETPTPPAPSFRTPNAWINEIHYDKIAVGEGEFIEIIIDRPEIYEMVDFDLYLYDGTTGGAYRTVSGADFVVGELDSTFQVYTYTYPAGEEWINNANAGIALTYEDRVIQFLSYDGSFTATDGPANGLISSDIGVSQNDSPEDGYSLQLIGDGVIYYHFTWVDPPASPGAINQSQTILAPDVVPFRLSYLFFVFGAIALAIVYRKIR